MLRRGCSVYVPSQSQRITLVEVNADTLCEGQVVIEFLQQALVIFAQVGEELGVFTLSAQTERLMVSVMAC